MIRHLEPGISAVYNVQILCQATLYPCQKACISRQASSSVHNTDLGSGGRGLKQTTRTVRLLHSSYVNRTSL